jgi:hypothetical protein
MRPTSKLFGGIILAVTFVTATTFLPILTCYGFVMISRAMDAYFLFEGIFGLIGFVFGLIIPVIVCLLIYDMADTPNDNLIGHLINFISEKEKQFDKALVDQADSIKAGKVSSWLSSKES